MPLKKLKKYSGEIHVWAVLGESDSGKSTVIGHLISQFGKGAGGQRLVPLRGGGVLRLYARRQSVQEAQRTPDDVINETEQVALKLENKSGITSGRFNLLIALRTDKINKMPKADVYLSKFIEARWKISSIAVLNFSEVSHWRYRNFGSPFLGVDDDALISDKAKHGLLAGKVRNHFDWT